MILYVAIAGLFGFMFAMVGVSLMDIPELEKSQLRLGSVEVTGVNTIENHAKLQVSFLTTKQALER